MSTEKALMDYCSKYEKIYCYGAGKFGREVMCYLREQEKDIDGFFVTELDEKNNVVFGKKVRCIDDILKISMDKVGLILSVGHKYYAEMSEKLRQLGIADYFWADDELMAVIEKLISFEKMHISESMVNILLYHRIVDFKSDYWNIKVSTEHFEQHIKWISENYQILRFDDDWESVKKPSVVITFDDGYRDNILNALPILEKYNVPATFFISSGYIGEEKLFWWDELYGLLMDQSEDIREVHKKMRGSTQKERELCMQKLRNGKTISFEEADLPMSLPELQRLSQSPLVTIGAHTVMHSSMRVPAAVNEIKEGKKELERMINKAVNVFSYPFGDYCDRALEELGKANFTKAATTITGLAKGSEPFLIPRNAVPDCDLESFKRFLNMTFLLDS